MINSYKDLIVWQKSIELVTDIYKATKYFPKEELYGLTSQIRRAAVSIPSNIAEGRARNTRREYNYFIKVAYGSGAELETQIQIAKNLGFVISGDMLSLENKLSEIMRMLNSLHVSLSKNSLDCNLPPKT